MRRLPPSSVYFTLLALVGCSDDSGGPSETSPVTTETDNASDSSAGTASNSTPTTGSTAPTHTPLTSAQPTSPGDTSGAEDTSTASPAEPSKPLLEGEGVEYRGIVNLVGEDVTKAVEDYLLNPALPITSEYPPLDIPIRAFYSNYSTEDYDILYFITADSLPGAGPDGLHMSVTNPGLLGTGQERPEGGFFGPARLHSAVGIVGHHDRYPPFAHELLHGYAVHLDAALGFPNGDDVDFSIRGHWGLNGINGKLGGFNASTLACETPAGARPPDCAPTANGTFRYLVDFFMPNTDLADDAPFAPMELYLMGLLPRTEVTSPIVHIDGANVAPTTWDFTEAGQFVIEGTGISELSIDDIVAHHGEVPLLAEDKRHVSAAFVLVTRQAATQEQLDRVADWAAAFSGELELPAHPGVAYSALTGGRGTLSHRVGAQRALGPEDYLDFSAPWSDKCDHLAQDCAEGTACYGTSVGRYCAVPGDLQAGEICETDSECQVGLVCAYSITESGIERCAPYCNHLDDAAADACAGLCPTAFTPIYHGETLEELGAHCYAGAGGACSPLADDCADGQACSGWEPSGCHVPGDIPLGQECSPLGDECEAGTTCIAIAGASQFFCQPYCDNVNTAADNSCDTLCANGAFQFDGYGICVP